MYTVFYNSNPEIDTEPSVGGSDTRLAGFFLNILKHLNISSGRSRTGTASLKIWSVHTFQY